MEAKGVFLGRATNNVAEYSALVKSLEAVTKLGAKQVVVFSDSQLLVRQINGQYKVKSEGIKPFYRQAVSLLAEFESWQVNHIPREKNKQAEWSFNVANKVEEIHAGLFKKTLQSIENNENIPSTDYYVCNVCGHTAENEAPEKCPVCGAPRNQYNEIK